jgi:hypothetical protein
VAPPDLCLRIGPDIEAPRVLFVPPLFEEANRMRRTLVMAMRALAAQGIGSLLPDLPGQNDSLLATEAADLEQWRTALAAIVAAEPVPLLIAGVRGGALIDNAADAIGWWRLAPVTGASLLRTMLRTRVTSDREAGRDSSTESLMAEAAEHALLLAGNCLSPAMIAGLHGAVPADAAPCRTVTLGTGTDQIAGSPLWLRAEPGEDAALADAMAADIAAWVTACAAR